MAYVVQFAPNTILNIPRCGTVASNALESQSHQPAFPHKMNRGEPFRQR